MVWKSRDVSSGRDDNVLKEDFREWVSSFVWVKGRKIGVARRFEHLTLIRTAVGGRGFSIGPN